MAHVKASAVVSHVGRVRQSNQDSGYAGRGLFFVADGMGGHAGGDVASAIAAHRFADTDHEFDAPDDAASAMRSGLYDANAHIAATVADHPELAGMGTTVSAIQITGHNVIVAHIGDSRVYLLRSGELSQITTDHTFVQRLVEAGRITEEEAMVHPRRSVLMRVLGDVDTDPEVDTMVLDARPGDRWILCSDGLSGVVPFADIQTITREGDSAKQAADRLLRASLTGGAPDNVTVCIVDLGEPPAPQTPPQFVGSAAAPLAFGQTSTPLRSRAIRLAPFRPHPVQESHFEPDTADFLDVLIEEDRRRRTRRRAVWIGWITAFVILLAGGTALAYSWTQTRYYVGDFNGRVAIYQGVQQDLGPISLHHLRTETDLATSSLAPYDQQLVKNTVTADTYDQAAQIVQRLRENR